MKTAEERKNEDATEKSEFLKKSADVQAQLRKDEYTMMWSEFLTNTVEERKGKDTTMQSKISTNLSKDRKDDDTTEKRIFNLACRV